MCTSSYALTKDRGHHLIEQLVNACLKRPPASKDALRALQAEGANVNGYCYRHDKKYGIPPLIYVVDRNDLHTARVLIELGADTECVQGERKRSPLACAILNKERDGTPMVRLLLSLGASTSSIDNDLEACDAVRSNLTMQYWMDVSRGINVQPKLKGMLKQCNLQQLPEVHYAAIGQRSAISMIFDAVFSHVGDVGAARGKPLVIMLAGAPGHGKTILAKGLATALCGEAGETNHLMVHCGQIRDDADLFGSRLGGFSGTHSSDGDLVKFLREQQGQRCVVVLDEFEKPKGLASALGWEQDGKIYKSFLELWQEGTLTDRGSGGADGEHGQQIDCSKAIFICTTNEGQEEIIDFAQTHQAWLYPPCAAEGRQVEKVADRLQRELVKRTLRPKLIRFFQGMKLEAIVRRLNIIIPFIPFSKSETLVVSDTYIRHLFGRLREPPAPDGPEPRVVGSIAAMHTSGLCRCVAECYEPMEGASSLENGATQHTRCVKTDYSRGKFDGHTPHSTPKGLPICWVHAEQDDGVFETSVHYDAKPEDVEEEIVGGAATGANQRGACDSGGQGAAAVAETGLEALGDFQGLSI
jgi:hypothetical protein